LNLRETINTEVKNAMKAKDTKKRDALIIQTQVKRRNDAATQYRDAGREDLLQIELDEIAFYEVYLPAQLSDDELASELKEIISKVGASTPKDMGKVMGMASKALAGKADGKRISECVKTLLA